MIIGAAGSVGTGVRKELSKDHTLQLLVHSTKVNEPEGEVFQGTITDYEFVNKAMRDMDGVVHLAIVSAKSGYWRDIEMNFNVNVKGTFNVCRAAIENKVKRLVYTSTGSIYACNKPTYSKPPSKGGPVFTEDIEPTPGPEYPYAITKYLGEKVVEVFAKAGLPSIILRLTGVTPADDWPPKTENKGNTTHISDVAQAIRLALENETIKFDIFNVAGGYGDSNFPAEKARRVLGYNILHGNDEI